MGWRRNRCGVRRPEGLDLRGLKVLVVDDNATNRRILREAVAAWGMRPSEADGCETALAALEEATMIDEPFRARSFSTATCRSWTVSILPSESAGFTQPRRPDHGHVDFRRSGGRRGPLPAIGHRRLSDEAGQAIGTAGYGVDGPESAGRHPVEPAPASVAPPPQPLPRPLQVLLAEDNSVNQRLAVRLLEKQGHTVVVANNGVEALAALERQPFDLILMDVQMPEMDGFEATARIRAREADGGRRQPIIAMTAHAMKGDRERCLAGRHGRLCLQAHSSTRIKRSHRARRRASWISGAAFPTYD